MNLGQRDEPSIKQDDKVTLYAREDRFEPVDCFPQEEFVKIHFFYQLLRARTTFRKLHFVFW
jgi:hypothetical protein